MKRLVAVSACLLLFTICGSFVISANQQTSPDVPDTRSARPKTLFTTSSGYVAFTSDAPLENIFAESNKLRGIVDSSASTFAFSVHVVTFEGFNSALQREHFNENYMETEKFPDASFSGRIIEKITYSIPGVYPVRAKGYLTIHGIKKERIIPCKVTVSETGFRIVSEFTVHTGDFGIKIPRIVYEKISPEIRIKVDAELKPTE